MPPKAHKPLKRDIGDKSVVTSAVKNAYKKCIKTGSYTGSASHLRGSPSCLGDADPISVYVRPYLEEGYFQAKPK